MKTKGNRMERVGEVARAIELAKCGAAPGPAAKPTGRKWRHLYTVVLMAELEKRGMTLRQLAKACSVTYAGMLNECNRGFASQRLRLQIDNFLDTPIFSSWEQFAARKRLAKVFGFDPNLKSYNQLKAVARERGAAGYGNIKGYKQHLIDFLATHIEFQKIGKRKK